MPGDDQRKPQVSDREHFRSWLKSKQSGEMIGSFGKYRRAKRAAEKKAETEKSKTGKQSK